MVQGITFDKQLNTSKADAERMFSLFMRDRIIKGCTVAYDAQNLYIGEGAFFIQGRLVEITAAESVPIQSGTNKYLVFTVDLSIVNTETAFNQGYFEIVNEPVHGDLFTDGKYQMVFAKYSAPSGSVTVFEPDDNAVTVPFPADGWSQNSAGAYVQTVAVEGITERDRVGYDFYMTAGASADTIENEYAAYSCTKFIESGNGTLTLNCGQERPESNFTIQVF